MDDSSFARVMSLEMLGLHSCKNARSRLPLSRNRQPVASLGKYRKLELIRGSNRSRRLASSAPNLKFRTDKRLKWGVYEFKSCNDMIYFLAISAKVSLFLDNYEL